MIDETREPTARKELGQGRRELRQDLRSRASRGEVEHDHHELANDREELRKDQNFRGDQREVWRDRR